MSEPIDTTRSDPGSSDQAGEPIDERALDEYLEGGSTVSQHYRQLRGDEVPPELDALVLRHAHDAVKKRRRSGTAMWVRWSAPVALAASAVLVLSIVIETGVQQDVVPTRVLVQEAPTAAKSERDAPASAPVDMTTPPEEPSSAASTAESQRNAEPAAADQSYVMRDSASATSASREPAAERKVESAAASQDIQVVARRNRQSGQIESAPLAPMLPEPAVPPPPKITTPPSQGARVGSARAPAPAGVAGSTTVAENVADDREVADESSALSEVIVTGYQLRRDAPSVRNAGPRGTISSRSAQSGDDDAGRDEQERKYSNPEDWLRDIRRLRQDGKQEEADREWQRFRASFPDHPVAESDTARGNQPRGN